MRKDILLDILILILLIFVFFFLVITIYHYILKEEQKKECLQICINKDNSVLKYEVVSGLNDKNVCTCFYSEGTKSFLIL